MTDDVASAPTRHASALGEVARSSAWGGLGALVAALLGFVLALLVARAVGTEGSGLFFAGVAMAMILIAFGALGADTGLLWSLPRDRALTGGARQRRLLWIALPPVVVSGAVLATAVFVAAPAVAEQIDPATAAATTDMLRVFALAVLVGPLLQCAVQATRGLGNVLPFVWLQQIGLPGLRVGAILTVVLIASSSTATDLAWWWALPVAVLLPVALGVAYRRSGSPRGAAADAAVVDPPVEAAVDAPVDAKAFWRYSLLRGIGTACSLSLTWSDVLLVAVLASPEAAGVYAAASRFATSGQLGLQAMRLGIGPQLSAAFARGQHERAQVLYSVTTRWSVLLSWPIFLTLALYAETVLGWFGPGFDAGATSLRILCVAMMFSVAVGNVATLLLMSGHSGWAARNTAVALVVNLGANLVLIPWIGAEGAAIAWLASVVVENGLGLLLIRRRLHIVGHGRSFALTAAVTTVSVAASGLALLAWRGQGTTGLLVHAAVAGAILLLYMVAARRALHLDLVLGRRRPARTGDVAP